MNSANSSSDATVVFIWSIPRTCSTALLKCLTFVDDVDAWMEPYQSAHFNDTWYNPEFRKGDPVAERMRADLAKNEGSESMKALRREITEKMKILPNLIAQKDMSYQWIKKQLELPIQGKSFVIVKDHSSAIVDHFHDLPDVPNCRHVLLIRHPRELYVSFKAMIWKRLGLDNLSWESCDVVDNVPFMPVKDLYQIQNRLWKHLEKSSEDKPILLDTFDLCSKPEIILPKLFEKLGIPYKESYLEWEAGDAVLESKLKGSAEMILLETKTNVMERAVRSSRFEPPKQPWGTAARSDLEITPELEEIIDAAMPYYEEMFARRLL